MRVLLSADPELPVPPQLYGGIERMVDILVRGLLARGHVVGLVGHRDSRVPTNRLFPWPGFRSQRPWDTARNILALWAAIHKFKPDIVHSFSRALYLLPSLPSRLPKIMSYQRKPGVQQIRNAAKIGRTSLAFTGCSEHISQEGRAAGGTWHTIHNCVEVNKYTFQHSVHRDGPLVFLSRVERIKGAHTAIAVAHRTGRRLVIAGNHGSVGEEGNYWRTEVLPHLGKNGIEYVGPVDDTQKNNILGRAVAMLVPIEWDEPFGIVFAESLACGTPVISCPRGALPEIIRNGVEGFLVNDVEEACLAVRKLEFIDRTACRRRAESTFSAHEIVSRYEALYHSMTDHVLSKDI
jgi:glycosyltransferase involved in cell wall biosynthesis